MISRDIGRLSGSKRGPTAVFIGSIHGNEPAGTAALEEVLRSIQENNIPFRGNIIALRGNLAAISQGTRFIDKDLNRIWTYELIDKARENGSPLPYKDLEELQELLIQIKEVFKNYPPPYYFLDLHTTSAPTFPFLAINDTLANRKAASFFPVPIILGIEEHVQGSLLNYINELGHVALGFEAGQHDDPISVDRHVSFIWATLHYARLMRKRFIPQFREHLHRLEAGSGLAKHFFEVTHRHGLEQSTDFTMRNGFENFQPIAMGTPLAHERGEEVIAPRGGRLFMPLYQNQGDDAYFIVRHIPRVWMMASLLLRRIQFDALLVLLPGVRRSPLNRYLLQVNTRIARFLALEIFHLLGYRRVSQKDGYLEFTRREGVYN